jgi:hypothetical protein
MPRRCELGTFRGTKTRGSAGAGSAYGGSLGTMYTLISYYSRMIATGGQYVEGRGRNGYANSDYDVYPGDSYSAWTRSGSTNVSGGISIRVVHRFK